MSYKNDDLNKLFRKTARDYPLKTGNSNWDDVAAKLDIVAAREAARKKGWKYPVILLLFAVSLIVLYEFQSDHSEAKQQIPRKKVSEQNISKLKSDKLGNNVVTINEDLKNTVAKQITFKGRESFIAKTNSEPVIKDDLNNNGIKKPLFNLNDITIAINEKQSEKVTDTYVQQKFTLKPGQQLFADNNNSIQEQSEEVSADEKKSLKIQLKPAYRIYGVLYGGMKLSTVKFQQIEKPGYRIGVGLGYKINNHFNVELSLQREQINFYTDGRYIDTSMLRIKSNKNIENVSASSKITSVPITLRYNFSSKSKGHFFVGAGTNAIVITHSEKYKYSVSKNGVENKLSKSYSALREPKYFSGVNLSAGYETKLCGLWNVKVEPYYQTPVHDFGVGRVPVTSFGIDIGIIRDLK